MTFSPAEDLSRFAVMVRLAVNCSYGAIVIKGVLSCSIRKNLNTQRDIGKTLHFVSSNLLQRDTAHTVLYQQQLLGGLSPSVHENLPAIRFLNECSLLSLESWIDVFL